MTPPALMLKVAGFCAVAIGWLVIGGASGFFSTYALVLVLFSLALVPFWIGAKSGPIDWLEGVYLYVMVFFLSYGGSAIYVLNSEWRYFRYVIDSVVWFDLALACAILGLIAFLCGYYSRFGSLLASRLPRVRLNHEGPSLFPIAIALVWCVGWIPRLVLLWNGQHLSFAISQFSDELVISDTAFYYLAWGTIFAQFLGAIYCFSHPHSGWWLIYLGVMLPAETVYTFLAGSKFYFIPLLVTPLIAYNYLRRRVRLVHFLLPWAVFVFVVFPTNVAYRSSVKYGDLKLATIFTDLPAVVARTIDAMGEEKSSLELAADRLMDIPLMATMLEKVPDVIEFEYGRTLFGLTAVVLVPTALLPAKYDLINEMLRPFYLLWGVTGDPSAGIAPTQVGELYFNFGVIGIAVGMFVFGVLLRTFYLWFIGQTNPITVLIYMGMWPLIGFSVEAWFFAVVNLAVKNFLLLAAIAWCLNRGRLFEWAGQAVSPLASIRR